MRSVKFLVIPLLAVSVFSVSNINHDLILRRVQDFELQTQTAALPYIPATVLTATAQTLNQPVKIVLDLAGYREEEAVLQRCDALLRMLSGNPNIEVMGIYGVTPQDLFQHLQSNVAHNNWRGMELALGSDYIEFNGTRVPITAENLIDAAERGEVSEDVVEVYFSNNKSGIFFLADNGITRFIRYADNAGFDVARTGGGSYSTVSVQNSSEISGLGLALETLRDSGLDIKGIKGARILDNEGAADISLEGQRPSLASIFGERLGEDFSSLMGETVLDRVHAAVENGGSELAIEVRVGPDVTKDDLDAAFQAAAEASGGAIAFADPHDVVVSGYFIDVDSGHRLVGPSFVYSSRDTTLKNGIAVIHGWTSDYAVARSVIDELMAIGEASNQPDDLIAAQNSIPAVVREDAKTACVADPVRIGIYGSGGRIGTAALASMIGDPNFNPVVIAGVRNVEELVNMLRQDTARGHIYADIQGVRRDGQQFLVINGKEIPCFARADSLSDLPWDEYNVEFAIDATGKFKTRDQLEGHLEAGAESAGLTVAPKNPGDNIPQLVPGVNGEILLQLANGEILSFATCTTNNITTALSVLQRLLAQEYGDDFIPQGVTIETDHAITKTQSSLDGQATEATNDLTRVLKNAERGAASTANILITSTGAAKAAPFVITAWPADVYASAVAARVGNLDGSVTTARIYLAEDSPFTTEDIQEVFRAASEGYLSGILQYHDSEIPYDSRAILMNPHTSIIESSQILVNGDTIEFKTWYDNEWGYTQQVMRAIIMYRLALDNPGLNADELLEFSNRLERP
jgi:glyceraldehyde 3-phosphate dehydrogenase